MPFGEFKTIFIKGLPLMLNELFWAAGMTTVTQCYSVRGLSVIAGLNIATTITNLFNIVFIQLGACISIVVGQYLGAGELEKAKDADYIIYVWNLGGKPSTLSDFTGYNSILADIKAVKDGNVWCTTPDFFQIADTIGSMINDINLMLNADADTSELTYLKKLK